MAANEILIKLGVNGQAQVLGAFNKLTSTAGRLRLILGTLGAITGAAALVELTRKAINTADEMGKLAQKTGIGVEALSALSHAAKLGDLDQQEFANALKFLGKEMAETGRGSESLQDRLLEIADTFSRMPDGPNKTALALEHFGRAGVAMIPFLNQGSEAIRKQREEAEAFGLVIDERFAKNADAFNDNIDRIKAAFQGVFLRIAEDVLPTLIRLTDQFIAFIRESPAIANAVQFISTEIRLLGEIIEIATNRQRRFLEIFNVTRAATAKAFADAVVASLNPLGDALKKVFTKHSMEFDEASIKRASVLLAELKQKTLALLDPQLGKVGAAEIDKAKTLDEIANLKISEDEKARLVEALRRQHQLRLAQIHQEGQDKIVADERAAAAEREHIQATVTQGASDMFGNLAATAKAFGRKGFIAWKSFATAQAVVDTYKSAVGAYSAMVGIPYVGPVLAIAASAAAIGAGLANVAAIQHTNPNSYQVGGYTGNLPTNQIAGQVHGQEFVFNAERTSQLGVQNLQALHDGDLAPASIGGRPAPTVNNVILFDESAVRQMAKSRAFSDGVLNIVRVNKMTLGIA